MAIDASAAREELAALLDAGGDRLGEIGLLTVLAIAKGWQAYTERRGGARAGRRAADLDCASMVRSLAKIEKSQEALAANLAALAAAVQALEAARNTSAPP